MATLTKVLSDLTTNGFTQAELDAVENASVKRDYFVEGQVYGGATATTKGTWAPAKIRIVVNKNNELTRKIVWACVFTPDGAKAPVADLTKSFLLSSGRYDKHDNHIAPKGDVRTWGNNNIIHGKLDKEWANELATLLNSRGLRVVVEQYQCGKKDGGSFTATIQHPYFADTFGK